MISSGKEAFFVAAQSDGVKQISGNAGAFVRFNEVVVGRSCIEGTLNGGEGAGQGEDGLSRRGKGGSVRVRDSSAVHAGGSARAGGDAALRHHVPDKACVTFAGQERRRLPVAVCHRGAGFACLGVDLPEGVGRALALVGRGRRGSGALLADKVEVDDLVRWALAAHGGSGRRKDKPSAQAGAGLCAIRSIGVKSIARTAFGA